MAGSRWSRRMPPRTATEGIMPKSNTRKLNDTQLVILSSASQREDGFAVLPEGVRAASVKAAAYWDGGYMGNPAIYPLIYHCETPDVVVVHINPMTTNVSRALVDT